MKRSILFIAGICSLLYLILLPYAPAYTLTINVPGWLWLASRIGGFACLLVWLRAYAPAALIAIEDFVASLHDD